MDRARQLFEEALPDLARDPFERGHTLWGLGRASLREEPPDTNPALDYLRRARDEFLGSYPREWIGVTKDIAEALRLEDPREARRLARDVEREALTHHLVREKVWALDFMKTVGTGLSPRIGLDGR